MKELAVLQIEMLLNQLYQLEFKTTITDYTTVLYISNSTDLSELSDERGECSVNGLCFDNIRNSNFTEVKECCISHPVMKVSEIIVEKRAYASV